MNEYEINVLDHTDHKWNDIAVASTTKPLTLDVTAMSLNRKRSILASYLDLT